MSWPVYLAIKQLFPTGRRFPFFTCVSILGVALGVALLVVTISIMGGFGKEIRRMIVETSGHIQIRGNGPLLNSKEILKQTKTHPAVLGATPYAEGVVMVMAGERPAFPAIQGVDLNHVEEVVPLSRYIYGGSLEALDDDSVILSAQLATSLGVSAGDVIELYTPLMLEKIRGDEVLLPRAFTVAGYFQIGHNQLDSSLVICTIRTMQDLYGLGSAVHGISVRLKENVDEYTVAKELDGMLPPYARAGTWLDNNRDFLFILQLEKNLLFFLLLFIVVVAAFSVASSLLISVVRKTREIGLIAALGGSSRSIALCYCFQGFFIGVAGTLSGVAIGFTGLHFRNDLVQAFAQLTQSQEAFTQFYQFSKIPAHIPNTDLVLIIVSSIVISTLAALLPAWRAAKLKPAEALRSE